MPLRPNIADWDLKKEMTYIPVNGTISVEWDILKPEISQFIIDGSFDVTAVFSVVTNVYDSEKNDVGEFISSSKIIITGNDLDENKR